MQVGNKYDYYPTVDTRALRLLRDTISLKHLNHTHRVLECCSGENHITDYLISTGLDVTTNDVNPEAKSNYHMDVTSPVSQAFILGLNFDWIITNPPYNIHYMEMVYEMFLCAKVGAAFLLPNNWIEPTTKTMARQPYLDKLRPYMTDMVFFAPRISFSGDGKSGKRGTSWLILQHDTSIPMTPHFVDLNKRYGRK